MTIALLQFSCKPVILRSMPDKRMAYQTPFGQFCATLSYGEVSELARKAGISYTTLWRMAAGKSSANRRTAARLMNADERITFGMLWPEDYE